MAEPRTIHADNKPKTEPPKNPPSAPRTPPPPSGPKKADAERRKLGTPAEVSDYLQVPVTDLYQWRHKGTGPRASKVGRHLRYRWGDVEKWLDEQAKTA
jgi:predicted DNA-binding transcriptional regulator AlpA